MNERQRDHRTKRDNSLFVTIYSSTTNVITYINLKFKAHVSFFNNKVK